MRAGDAKENAGEWVRREGVKTPGFVGAFFHGSVNWLRDDEDLTTASDLDVMLVLERAVPVAKPGKLVYQDTLLEISYLRADAVNSASQVLGEYNLAGSFHRPSVIADPTGNLTRLNRDVIAGYTQRQWVRRRCQQAYDKVVNGLARLDESAPFHHQAITWLFATGVMTHVLLVAGLRNPTVRKRYLAVRELLAEYGRLDYYEVLLGLLGCDQFGQEQAAAHLERMGEAFDAAASVICTPFPFASDLSQLARPIAVDGSRELIAVGNQREAAFWMAVTYSRCMQVFCADAPELLVDYGDGYRALMGDLGIGSYVDLVSRREDVMAEMGELWKVTEGIIATNIEIADG